MRLTLQADRERIPSGEEAVIRIVVFDDEDEAVIFGRGQLLGPNLAGPHGPFPLSAEPEFEDPELNDIALNPGCYYGRERRWSSLPAGEYRVTGMLMSDEPGSIELEAEPLVLRVEP